MTAHQQAMVADLLLRLKPYIEAIYADEPISGADLTDLVSDWVVAFHVTPEDADNLFRM